MVSVSLQLPLLVPAEVYCCLNFANASLQGATGCWEISNVVRLNEASASGWVDVEVDAEKREPRPDTVYVMAGAGAVGIKYRRTQTSGTGNHTIPCCFRALRMKPTTCGQGSVRGGGRISPHTVLRVAAVFPSEIADPFQFKVFT